MIGGVGILAVTATLAGRHTTAASMTMYVIGFVVLFLLSGIGNGAVYKMIPSIFEAASRSLAADEKTRADYSRSMSGAVIGITGAIGGLGGVVSGVISAAGRLRHSAVGHVQFHAAAHAAVTAHRGDRLHAPSRHPSIGPMVAPPYFDAPRRRLRPYQLDLSPRVRSL
jgi:nitrate/nitrite transporter NarK